MVTMIEKNISKNDTEMKNSGSDSGWSKRRKLEYTVFIDGKEWMQMQKSGMLLKNLNFLKANA